MGQEKGEELRSRRKVNIRIPSLQSFQTNYGLKEKGKEKTERKLLGAIIRSNQRYRRESKKHPPGAQNQAQKNGTSPNI